MILFFFSAPGAPPPAVELVGLPGLSVEVDFLSNPTSRYTDIHTTDDGVVSHWRLNSTTTVLDSMGLNNGVQISTPATIAGPYSYDTDLGLTFDGTNDSAYVLTSESLTRNTQFSVDFWVRVAGYPASTKDLVGKRGSWIAAMNTTGHIVWTLKDDTSTVVITSGAVIPLNTWTHITGVYDDANSLLYINGVLDTSTAYASGMELGPQPIRFAASGSTTVPTWQSSQTATASATTVVVTKPASTASGDLLIAHVGGHSGVGASVITPPAGWTLYSSQNPTVNTWSIVYYKVAGGSEPADYTWTSDITLNWNGAISRITGQHTLEPFANIAYSTVQLTTVAAHPTGAHVANLPNTLVLALAYVRGAQTFTADSGTERYDFQSGNGMAMYSQAGTESSLEVIITSSGTQVGAAHMVIISGSGDNETACSLKDVTYWNRALDANDAARNYESRFGGTGTWTPLKVDVRSFSVVGANRQYELDRMVAGGSAFPLRDPLKNYDPGNTSSIYAPNVITERKLRAQATWNETTYDLCRHFVDRWPPQSLGLTIQEIDLEATDGFDLLALAGVEGTLAVGFSGAQINTLLNKALWPVADRAIDAGQYVMNARTIAEDTSALALIQEIADSERGLFFMDAAGVATFHDAAHRGTQPRSVTSQATFSDHAVGGGIIYKGISPPLDKDRITNDWRVTPDSGVVGAASQRQVDWASAQKFGLRFKSRSTALATNDDAHSQAGNLLNETAIPAQRFESLLVIPTTTAAYDTCLGLRISDRVTIKRGFDPNWQGAELTKDCFIEGKTISAKDAGTPWSFVFQLSPVSSGNYYGTIMRDEPISYWRMDTIT